MSKPASNYVVNPSDSLGLSTSLLACWPMLAGSGTAVDDLGNTLGTYAGTLVNGVTWGAGTDTALLHHSAGAYVALSSDFAAVPLKVAAGTNWSLAFRAKQTSADAQGAICGVRGSSSDLVFLQSGNTVWFRSNTGGVFTWTVASTTVTADYVITYDQTNLRLYYNGTLVSAQALASGRLWINALGHGYFSDGSSLVGTLEHLSVWSGRVLTATDAGNLASNPYSFLQAPPAATNYATLASATSGLPEASVTLTVRPNGVFTGTVTATLSGAGFNGKSIPFTFSGSNVPAAQTATFAPTAVGTCTITWTNSGSLTNPSNTTYTTTGIAKPSGTLTVNGGNALSATMSHAWVFNEARGTSVTDVVAGANLTATGLIQWDRSGGNVVSRSLNDATTQSGQWSLGSAITLTGNWTFAWSGWQIVNDTHGCIATTTNGGHFIFTTGTAINLRTSVAVYSALGNVQDYTLKTNHYALTSDGTTIRFYINGSLIGSAASASSNFTFSQLFGVYSATGYHAGWGSYVYTFSSTLTAANLLTLAGDPFGVVTGSALVPGPIVQTALTATSATVSIDPPSAGTSPYTYQLQRSLDGINSWANTGTLLTSQTGSGTITDTTASGTAYNYRLLYSDAGSSYTLSAKVASTLTPTNTPYQTFQRTAASTGPIVATGTVPTYATSVQVSTDNATWTTIANTSGTGTLSGGVFSGTLSGVAIGNSTLYYRLGDNAGVAANVANVRVGDVFAVAWQSNAAGRLLSARTFTANGAIGVGSMCRLDGTWAALADPTGLQVTDLYTIQGSSGSSTSNGSYWPAIGSMLVADEACPVAFITTADGGTGMTGTAVFPDDSWHAPYGQGYTRLKRQISRSGTNAVKAILCYGGEADMATASLAVFKAAIENFAQTAASEIAGAPPTLYFASGYPTNGPSGSNGTDNVNLGQFQAADDGENSGSPYYHLTYSAGSLGHLSNLVHPGSDTSGNATIIERSVAGQFFATIKDKLRGTGTLTSRLKVASATYSGAGATAIKVKFNQTLKTGLTLDSTLFTVSDSAGAKAVSAVAYHADPTAVTLTVAALASSVVVSYGLGGAQAGKVNVQTPDYTLPASYGTLNLPAERFASLAATITSAVGAFAFRHLHRKKAN